ncbi:MAG: universal stress protein [Candidatus Jettenia sp.]|nr:MAG: universal stress protein [Candidatus Jettenia sp.]
MTTLKKILCPIDFSPCSTYALNYAIDLSMKDQASLYLIYVIETHINNVGDVVKQIDLSLEDQQTDNLKIRLINLIPGKTREKIYVDTFIVKGIPFVEIIKAAKDKQVDLIIMGTHGRTGLKHILIGSVAERVIQKAPCPVLSIRLPEQLFSMP